MPPPPPPPTIRLISSTPSATGLSSSEPNSSVGNITASDSSWASVGLPLAPKPTASNTPRRRLVPKKSKLGLLGKGANDENKERGKDFSDVMRRVGASSLSQRGGFDIYVDSSNDPELGEILMVKKQKSRAGLNDLAWGPLGETTNIPSTTISQHDKQNTKTASLKPKTEEKEKWWTIGRGRKDSKDKEGKMPREKSKSKSRTQASENRPPLPPRSKTPEPLRLNPQEGRARFNSLDSGILLNSPATFAPPTPFQAEHPAVARPHDMQRTASGPAMPRSATPTMNGLLAPPSADSATQQFGTNASNQGSVALRAIRSMKSLARIGSWAQLRGDENTVLPKEKEGTKGKKSLEKEKKKDKGDDKKKKRKEEKKEKPQAPRHLSTSSFEAGALSTSPEKIENTKTLGLKKRSILGLGLPSSMRLPTVRGGSTASSIGPAAGMQDNNRLSVESATRLTCRRDRAGSVLSTASSLRPPSTASGESRLSSGSSFRSVRWDDRGMQSATQQIKKDRADKRESVESQRAEVDLTARRTSRESKHSVEGRRRTPLTSIFRDMAEGPESPESGRSVDEQYPLVTVEEATSDGHSAYSQASTPVKATRRRPVSEQLLGRSRPRPMHEDGEGVISVLDAATNDLAQLITTLDLEATPSSNYDVSPWRTEAQAFAAASQESPLRRTLTRPRASPSTGSLRPANPSIQSLRPYAQSRGYQNANKTNAIAQQIGQQIAPWSALNNLSPVKEKSPVARRLCQKQASSATPSPAGEASPVFQPLRPAKSRPVLQPFKLPEPDRKSSDTPPSASHLRHKRGMSSTTFGSPATSAGSKSSLADFQPPVFRAPEGKKVSSGSRRSRSSYDSLLSNHSRLPITTETKRVLGMSGTMGGSDTSAYRPVEMDGSDPDSDIPEELQVILHNSDNEMDDTMSFPVNKAPPSPGMPPELPLPLPTEEPPALPVLRLTDEEDQNADMDESSGSEDDTKKSFDFTGELQALNESGGSDRRSFVEQLENAFRTPAKVDFTGLGPFLDIPPVPPLPAMMTSQSFSDSSMTEESSSLSVPSVSQIADMRAPTFAQDSHESDSAGMDMASQSQLIDMKEPTFMPPPDVTEYQEESCEAHSSDSVHPLRGSSSSSSAGSRPSNGQLNRAFKFGGLPSPSPQKEQLMTLSDIIPPPSHVRSLSQSSQSQEGGSSIEDDSVLKSIFARATNLPGQDMPRVRMDSDASSKVYVQDDSQQSQNSHSTELSRPSSGISFTGFDSFDEVRRGFEFTDNRPAFYPPPSSQNVRHNRHESFFSIASVSSYGGVINSGAPDPFGFAQDMGLPSLRERPSSEDMSMSMSLTVDDTFSFLKHEPRRRVDSDASSFYFRPPPANMSRGHRKRDSNMSVMSQGPPISLYNRSFGVHRRNDSNTSMSSMAHSYAMHGAAGGRMAWATHHKQEASVDSVMSDFSAMHLGRPGLGDKMFETDGQPLAAISASPDSPADSIDDYMHSIQQRMPGNRYSYDSILDDEQRHTTRDSLLDRTDDYSSMSDESIFGYHGNSYQGHLLPPNQFRPLSMISNASIHSPAKEDDTMISMLGGGHVRRRSIDSMIEGSPCVGIGKRKHVLHDEMDAWDQAMQSPSKARILSKPSIASTSSHQFGDERMIRARHGLLERQSLEESVLIAEGEDLSASFGFAPVFSRPGPKTRSRSSTYTASSGADTPPLSASDGSSISDGSPQSSIDLSHLNMALTNTTHPITRLGGRARPPGHGHRRRASRQAHMSHISRSSVYETIEEESSVMMSPAPSSMSSNMSSDMSKVGSPTAAQPVYVVDADDTRSIDSGNSISLWDDDHGIVALRKYYALRDEAENTVSESKNMWLDTPFSLFALQAFDPPRHPAGMQALLEHSIQNYGPLPSEIRAARARARTSSRPSPYPQKVTGRISKQSIASLQERSPSTHDLGRLACDSPLREVHVDKNSASPAKPLSAKKGNAAIVPTRENAYGLAPEARPKTASVARRAALGWTKRSSKSSTSAGQKENAGQGTLATPGESLRINRARPRARQTPATQPRQIRL